MLDDAAPVAMHRWVPPHGRDLGAVGGPDPWRVTGELELARGGDTPGRRC